MQYCPVCGAISREIYRNQGGWGVAVGCEHCYTPPIDADADNYEYEAGDER